MHVPSSQTASTLLLSLSQLCQERFSSNCPAIDSLLTPLHHPLSHHDHYYEEEEEEQSGLPRGGILELIGPPGIGKSRTVMAFALAQAFRLERRGKVLIVDAEGSLNPSLLHETAAFFAKHNGYDEEQLRESVEKILYRRIDSTWLLLAFFNTLEHWLEDNQDVNLIIIDSLSSHLRPTLDLNTKKLLNDSIKSTLSSVCATRKVSFIFTTKMTIKLFGTDNRPCTWNRDAEAMMVPSTLSNDWLPNFTGGGGGAGEGIWKVLLYFDKQGERLARLLEAPVQTQARDVPFTMDAAGPYDHQAPILQNSTLDED